MFVPCKHISFLMAEVWTRRWEESGYVWVLNGGDSTLIHYCRDLLVDFCDLVYVKGSWWQCFVKALDCGIISVHDWCRGKRYCVDGQCEFCGIAFWCTFFLKNSHGTTKFMWLSSSLRVTMWFRMKVFMVLSLLEKKKHEFIWCWVKVYILCFVWWYQRCKVYK